MGRLRGAREGWWGVSGGMRLYDRVRCLLFGLSIGGVVAHQDWFAWQAFVFLTGIAAATMTMFMDVVEPPND